MKSSLINKLYKAATAPPLPADISDNTALNWEAREVKIRTLIIQWLIDQSHEEIKLIFEEVTKIKNNLTELTPCQRLQELRKQDTNHASS